MKRKYLPVLILGIVFSLLRPMTNTAEKDFRNLNYSDFALIQHPEDLDTIYRFSGIEDPQLIWDSAYESDYFFNNQNTFNRNDGILEINRAKTLYYSTEDGLFFKTANIYLDSNGGFYASETSDGWTYGSGYTNTQIVHDSSTNQIIRYYDTIQLEKAIPYTTLTLREYDTKDQLIKEVSLLGDEGKIAIGGHRIEIESVQELNGIQSVDVQHYSRPEVLRAFDSLVQYEYYDTSVQLIAKRKVIQFVF